jgi:prolyl 4-hydroxylase
VQFAIWGSDGSFSTVSAFFVQKHQQTRFDDIAIAMQGTSTGKLAALAAKSKKSSSNSAGFGSQRKPSSSSSSSSSNNMGGHGFQRTTPSKEQQETVQDSTIKLDKWGLPPPTDEDIFPLMSKDTEIISIDPLSMNYSISEVQQCLLDYFPNDINWDHVSLSDMSTTMRSPTIDSGLDPSGTKNMTLRLAHLSPPVLLIENFLTEEECLDVQNVVTDSSDNNSCNVVRVASKTISQYAISKRTSTSWFCSYTSIPTVLSKLKHILGVNDLSMCEEPQIVQYSIGQEFTWHYDEIPLSQATNNGGQRIATILIYLNTIPKKNGGCTTFRDLTNGQHTTNTPLSVQPIQGSVLIFFPSNRHGKPDDRTLHRSEPIVANEIDNKDVSKWILQIWIHEKSYKAALPSNNRIDDAYSTIDAESQRLGYI